MLKTISVAPFRNPQRHFEQVPGNLEEQQQQKGSLSSCHQRWQTKMHNQDKLKPECLTKMDAYCGCLLFSQNCLGFPLHKDTRCLAHDGRSSPSLVRHGTQVFHSTYEITQLPKLAGRNNFSRSKWRLCTPVAFTCSGPLEQVVTQKTWPLDF